MKNPLFWILAAGAAVAYFIFKKKPADTPADKLTGLVSGARQGATGTTASAYGFRVPTSGVLGGIIGGYGAVTGNTRRDANGAITVDLSKTIKDVGSFFGGLFRRQQSDLYVYDRAAQGYVPASRDPSIEREREYLTARATANAAGLGSGPDPFNPSVSILDPSQGHSVAFYTPGGTASPIPGRDFSLGGFDESTPIYQADAPFDYQGTFEGDIGDFNDTGDSILA